MELHLIRHADAAERGPAYPDDTQRPLTSKGERQAHALAEAYAQQRSRVDLLLSSPWLRAWQTAGALVASAPHGAVALPELAQGDAALTCAALMEAARGAGAAAGVTAAGLAGDGTDSGAAAVRTIAAVGHEPWLSQLAAYLLGAPDAAAAIVFRKAAVMSLSGELRRGGMRLEAFVPMRLRRMRSGR